MPRHSRRYREGGEQCTNCSRPHQEPHAKGGSRQPPTVARFVTTRAAAMAIDPATAEISDLPEADGHDGADSDAMDTAHNR